MEKEYKRISCHFYDKLESYASFKKKLMIAYSDEKNKVITAEVEIKTFETKNKSEYLITQKGKRIRLDQIISVEEINKRTNKSTMRTED
jgi:Rho-binding antiterminator